MAKLGTKKDLLELWLADGNMPIPNPDLINLADMEHYSKVYKKTDELIKEEAKRIKQYGEKNRELSNLQRVYIILYEKSSP